MSDAYAAVLLVLMLIAIGFIASAGSLWWVPMFGIWVVLFIAVGGEIRRGD
jgi:hypothetical protein